MAQGRVVYNVYPDDVDAFGIMHHANFIRYMERARTDWLESRGVKYNDLIEQGVNFVVQKIDIQYLKPAKLYDKIEIITRIDSRRKVSQVYEQIVRDNINKELVYCCAMITVVCVNEELKPRAFPQGILEEYRG